MKSIRMQNFNLFATIIVVAHSGETVCLARLEFSPDKTELPFVMKRRQFPICIGYSITIIWSQGQSFENVEVILNNAVFSHWQLHIALTRGRSQDSIKVCWKHDTMDPHSRNKTKNKKLYTKNTVFRGILKGNV